MFLKKTEQILYKYGDIIIRNDDAMIPKTVKDFELSEVWHKDLFLTK